MKLENPKKHWKEGAKENIWTTYYWWKTIFSKTCGTSHGAFFEQCLESNIVLFYTYDGCQKDRAP
jgi:hypothetical protein